MEVFVSEKNLPKSCENCDIYKLGLGCCLTDFSRKTPKTERHNRCPLKSLDQHDKEVIKEFAEKLKYIILLNNSDEETGDMPYVIDTNSLFEDITDLLKERGVE